MSYIQPPPAEALNGGDHRLFQQLRYEDNDHQIDQRALSLSHKYAGIGRRSSISDFQRQDANSIYDNEDAQSGSPVAEAAAFPGGDASGGKRALPSSLRYTGLGKRQHGVSAGMRYAGLGKRFPEPAMEPEVEKAGSDQSQSAGAEQQLKGRYRRFAVNLVDDDMNVDDDDDEYGNAAVIYGIKKAAAAPSGKPRIGVGMRYVGVGKRKLFNVKSRVDAGMRYMGIGKRLSYFWGDSYRKSDSAEKNTNNTN